MARPQTQDRWSEPERTSGYTDWDSLRHDLENLLRQVENRHMFGETEAPRQEPRQPNDANARHQAALRSVQKAVERFSEAAQSAAAHPRDDLEAAISEIRARTSMDARDSDRSGYDSRQSGYGRDPESRAAAADDFEAQTSYSPHLPRPMPRAPMGESEFDYYGERDRAETRREPARTAAPRDAEAIEGLKRLTGAVSAMSGRLERLEADMHATRESSGDIAEVAAQVGQLTHVVELLAGAVGEQSQFKRLESQIADLARLYAEGEKPEINALTRRIDELGATVDRLASLQVEEVGRTARGVESIVTDQQEAVRTQTQAFKTQGETMHAIEDGVRAIYDRIDALERTYAIAPEDLDRLTQEMSGVTEALKNSGDAETLAGIVDRLETLSRQIDGMGRAGDNTVAELSHDVRALSEAVREGIEPRFAALESRIDTLSNRMGETAPQAAPDFSEIEAQIRQLAARMDQTGQQLDGLAEMYKADAGRESGPDLQALAKMVAESASEEMARLRSSEKGLGSTDLDALEARLSRMFDERRAADGQGPLGDMADNLTRVDERLNRLEATLVGLSTQVAKPEVSAPPSASAQVAAGRSAAADAEDAMFDFSMHAEAPEPPAAARPTPTPAAPPPARPQASNDAEFEGTDAFSEPSSEPSAPRRAQRDDAMPRPPDDDRPLVDDELSMLIAPVEDWSSIGFDEPLKRQPDPAPAPAPQSEAAPPKPETSAPAPKPKPKQKKIDPSAIERPAPPRSSFEEEIPGFTPIRDIDDDVASDHDDAADDDSEATPTDRSTFIAAARRAVRSSQEARSEADAEPKSLFGRALARFQNTKAPSQPDTAAAPGVDPAPEPAPVETQVEPEAPVRNYARGRATVEDFEADLNDKLFQELSGKKQGSFLARNRRALMLAGALAVTVLLAANLVIQRLSTPAAATPDTVSAIEPEQTALPNTLLDPNPTGSINPDVATKLSAPLQPESPRQVLPATLTSEPLPGSSTLDPTFTHSVPPANEPQPTIEPTPVKLDLPPESVGPLELRQAAADGDPRAQFEIGAIYTEGTVTAQDFKSASVWYERAAAQGFVPAQYRLGNLYEHGNGVDKDLEEARLWYSRAAEAGNRMAMHNLASLYASGDLGDQKFATAAEWFERAANTGLTDSQFNLGMLYARGLGVSQDLKASYKWFSLAAEAGDKDAATARDDVGKSLDAEALKAAKAEVAAWHMTPINIPANFAPIGTWAKNFDPGQTITEKKVTEGVQRALVRLGYDPGSVDGVMGPKTNQAIKEFEQVIGMSPTGLINPRLLAVLGSQPV